jgi:hypothetical protein
LEFNPDGRAFFWPVFDTKRVEAGVDVDGDSDATNDLYGPWIEEVPLLPGGKPYIYYPNTGEISLPEQPFFAFQVNTAKKY